jgi:transposase
VRFAGIDVASEVHVVAIVDESGQVLTSPTKINEDAGGYGKLLGLLGEPSGCLVAMEATGHYWQNLFAALAAAGFTVSLINPVRTHRFAQEDLQRTKTDAIDALGIARFAAQKRPAATRVPDAVAQELRELVRLRERLVQDFGDRVRQLHRLVDLGFPEFTRYVKGLGSEIATAILHEYPTAESFLGLPWKTLAKLTYRGKRVHRVGEEIARGLVEAAKASVGRHHGKAYQVQIRYACEDLDVLRRRLEDVDSDVEQTLKEHEVGSLLTTIDGIGPQTSARIIAELGNPAEFRSGKALGAYAGIVPGLRLSGKKDHGRFGMSRMGNARLRGALWMPTLSAVRHNAWLKAYYERLLANGKLPKVALIACMRKLLGAIYSVSKNRRPFVARTEGAPA